MSADVGDVEVVAERMRMAMAEAGLTAEIRVIDGMPHVRPRTETVIRGFARAADIVGVRRRCVPCALLSPTEVAASPDCEGTGRCAPDSSVSARDPGGVVGTASLVPAESPGSPPSPPGA